MANTPLLTLLLTAGVLCQTLVERSQNIPLQFERRAEIRQEGTTSSTCGLQAPDPQPPVSAKGNWLGWGGGVYNNRWAASDAVLDTGNIGNLSLACSAKYTPAGVSAAPLVEDGVAYYPTWSGLLVALEYATCTTIWSINVTSVIVDFKPVSQGVVGTAARTTPVSDGGDVLFVGTLAQSLLLAVDKRSGELIDSFQVDAHPYAVLTQSPTFYNGLLYIGTSSLEEVAAKATLGYECCSFVGSMNALALKNGRLSLVWTTHMIPSGSGFSGAAIWGSQPAIDAIRQQVFIATGNVYNLPEDFEACQNQTANITVVKEGLVPDPCLPRNVWQEAVVALDLTTGRVNWVRQLSALDAWNVACVASSGLVPGGGNPDNCPATPGQDADFGIAPTFVLGSAFTPDGMDVVVVGQKNGNLYTLTAQAGTVVWSIVTGPDGVEGGLVWGIAVDDRAVYFTNTNSLRVPYKLLDGASTNNSAFGAVSLKDGSTLWLTAAPGGHSSFVAPTVVNDVILVGTTGLYINGTGVTPPGLLTPLDKTTGEVLRVDTLDAYFRGNLVAVHDYVMFGTGYQSSHPAEPGSFQVWKIMR